MLCVQNLLTLCTTPACDSERTMVGTWSAGSHVNRNKQHKWHNSAYLNHTGHNTYLPYAFGGGYILSLDLSKVRSLRIRLAAKCLQAHAACCKRV